MFSDSYGTTPLLPLTRGSLLTVPDAVGDYVFEIFVVFVLRSLVHGPAARKKQVGPKWPYKLLFRKTGKKIENPEKSEKTPTNANIDFCFPLHRIRTIPTHGVMLSAVSIMKTGKNLFDFIFLKSISVIIIVCFQCSIASYTLRFKIYDLRTISNLTHASEEVNHTSLHAGKIIKHFLQHQKFQNSLLRKRLRNTTNRNRNKDTEHRCEPRERECTDGKEISTSSKQYKLLYLVPRKTRKTTNTSLEVVEFAIYHPPPLHVPE